MSWRDLSDDELFARLSQAPFSRDARDWRALVDHRDDDDIAELIGKFLWEYE